MKYRVTTLLATIAILTTFTANAQTLYVDDISTTTEDCSLGNACALGVALGNAGSAYKPYIPGVTLNFAAGTYDLATMANITTPLVIDQSLITWTTNSSATLNATDLLYAVEIQADHVTIDGFEIIGDGGSGTETTWTGIYVDGGYTNWTIINNEIHSIGAKKPLPETLNHSYGIWARGGGTTGAREDIYGVNIYNNNIHDIGGDALVGINISAGNAIALYSITGSDVGDCTTGAVDDPVDDGCGAWIHGNTFSDLPEGKNQLNQSPPISDPTAKEQSFAILVLQDDDPDRFNQAVAIESNTYNGTSTLLSTGILIGTSNSEVNELNASFAGDVPVFVTNVGRKATIDELHNVNHFSRSIREL